MPDETPDAKPVETPSVPTPAPVEQPIPETPVTPSPAPEPVPAEEPTIADIVKQTFDAASQPEGEGAKSSVVPLSDKTIEGQAPAEVPPGQDVPFHEHPRWKEMLQSKTELETQLEQRKAYDPIVQAWQQEQQFCQQNGITPEKRKIALDFMAVLETNPQRARELLAPIWNQLSQLDGSVLPPDLKARVEAQTLDEASAKEIAVARAQLAAHQRREQAQQQQATYTNEQSIRTAISDWDLAKRASDPSFKPKQDPKAVDGIWELTNAYLNKFWVETPPLNAQGASGLVEKAFTTAKQVLAPRLATPAPSRVLTSTRSAVQSQARKKPQDAETTSELVKLSVMEATKDLGITWNPE